MIEKNMIGTTILWHDAAKELPEKSCDVLVIVKAHDTIQKVGYSNLHKAFNSYDTSVDVDFAFTDVVAWAYSDGVVEQVKGAMM